MDAIREVGPGGHYLGCEHTQANFKTAFWRTDLFDYKPFETWAEEGARDTETLATERVTKMLGDYSGPAAGRGHREALRGLRRANEGLDARRLHLSHTVGNSDPERSRQGAVPMWTAPCVFMTDQPASPDRSRASASSAISTSMWRATE